MISASTLKKLTKATWNPQDLTSIKADHLITEDQILNADHSLNREQAVELAANHNLEINSTVEVQAFFQGQSYRVMASQGQDGVISISFTKPRNVDSDTYFIRQRGNGLSDVTPFGQTEALPIKDETRTAVLHLFDKVLKPLMSNSVS